MSVLDKDLMSRPITEESLVRIGWNRGWNARTNTTYYGYRIRTVRFTIYDLNNPVVHLGQVGKREITFLADDVSTLNELCRQYYNHYVDKYVTKN